MRWIPGSTALLQLLANRRSKSTGNHRWVHLPEWSTSIAGAWWLRRSLFAPEDLAGLMGVDAAREALRDFDARRSVEAMSGPLPADPRLALGQAESTTYLRNQLLRDSDWASMDHSVELRTPLVDVWLLEQVKAYLPSFARFANKELLARAPAHPLPNEVIRRRKTGFGIPVSRWLAGRKSGMPEVGSRGWARELAIAYQVSAG